MVFHPTSLILDAISVIMDLRVINNQEQSVYLFHDCLCTYISCNLHLLSTTLEKESSKNSCSCDFVPKLLIREESLQVSGSLARLFSTRMRFLVSLLCALLAVQNIKAFGPLKHQNIAKRSAQSELRTSFKWASAILITSVLAFGPIDTAIAADAKKPLLTYKSGKSPTAANPNDPKQGTKKEPSFLRCVSNCKSDCQKPGEGLAKNDCVSDCQDQCCASYEQCSFKIKSSAGNSI